MTVPALPAGGTQNTKNVVYLSERVQAASERPAQSAPGNVLPFIQVANDKKPAEDEDSTATRQALRREIFDLISNEELRDQIPRETLQEMVRIAREGLKKVQTPKK